MVFFPVCLISLSAKMYLTLILYGSMLYVFITSLAFILKYELTKEYSIVCFYMCYTIVTFYQQ